MPANIGGNFDCIGCVKTDWSNGVFFIGNSGTDIDLVTRDESVSQGQVFTGTVMYPMVL